MIPYCLTEVSRALSDRYLHSFQLCDVEEQIFLCRAALGTLPTSCKVLASATRCLGVALRTYFERSSSNSQPPDNAIDLHELACDLSDNHYDRSLSCIELGLSLRRRFDCSGDLAVLDRALDCLRRAHSLSPPIQNSRAYMMHNLGVVLCLHYDITGVRAHLNEAFELLHAAAALRPPGHRDRHVSLHFLANATTAIAIIQPTIDRHWVVACSLYQETIDLRPPSNPERGETLTMLAKMYRRRYHRFQDTADLQQAITYVQEALDFGSSHSCVLARRDVFATSLCIMLHERFAALGDMTDLDQAIHLQRDAIITRPQGHLLHPNSLRNIGNLLMTKYSYSQEADDLTDAISFLEEGLRVCPIGHYYRNEMMNQLVEARRFRYELTGMSYDVVEAISLLRASLVSDREETPASFQRLDSLAQALSIQFVLSGDLDSLDQAISTARQVLSHRHAMADDKRLCLQLLSSCLRQRFSRKGEPQDILEALGALQSSYNLYPPWHPERAHLLAGQARLHITRGAPYFSVTAALALLFEALQDQARNPQLHFGDATDLLPLLEEVSAGVPHDAQQGILTVYRLVIGLLPRVAYFGLAPRSRLKALQKADSYAVSASIHALALGQPEISLEILEEGRAVFWQQYLRLRTPFDNLPENLSKRLVETSRLLEQGAADGGDKVQQDLAAVQKRRLSEEFERLIAEVRSLPGQERFLLHDAFADIRLSAANGPVLILIAGIIDSHAVFIRTPTDGAEHIPLPNVTITFLHKLAVALKNDNARRRDALVGRGMRKNFAPGTKSIDVLSELWVKVMLPIIRHVNLQ